MRYFNKSAKLSSRILVYDRHDMAESLDIRNTKQTNPGPHDSDP